MTNAQQAAELVVSLGDPQGIGPEVSRKAAEAVLASDPNVRCVLVGDPDTLRRAGVDDRWERIEPGSRASSARSRIETRRRAYVQSPPSAEAGLAALEALDVALERTASDPRRALVTAPVSKEAVRLSGAAFDGHTGRIAARFKVTTPVMLFATPKFRVALATVHMALSKVPSAVIDGRLDRIVRVIAYDLERRFGAAKPRIHVLGLNPHAGEGGAFGDEEVRFIRPQIEALRRDGCDVSGPYPADAYFLDGFESRADCVVALYHDQGLVAVKSLAFREAVNVTLGLPIVRTSPDHGTAFDRAWKGTADAAPTEAAMRLAVDLVRRTSPERATEIPPAATGPVGAAAD